jgi:hypothetical protein
LALKNSRRGLLLNKMLVSPYHEKRDREKDEQFIIKLIGGNNEAH